MSQIKMGKKLPTNLELIVSDNFKMSDTLQKELNDLLVSRQEFAKLLKETNSKLEKVTEKIDKLQEQESSLEATVDQLTIDLKNNLVEIMGLVH